jgi:hypothetical protein
VPDRAKFLPVATCCPLTGSVIFTPSDVCCWVKALTEEIEIVDTKRIMVAENINLSEKYTKLTFTYVYENDHMHIKSQMEENTDRLDIVTVKNIDANRHL